jgi:hypothetical protein
MYTSLVKRYCYVNMTTLVHYIIILCFLQSFFHFIRYLEDKKQNFTIYRHYLFQTNQIEDDSVEEDTSIVST